MITHRVRSRPVPVALECFPGTALMRLARLASLAAVSISVAALCHLQRVQGSDQFYRQPLPAVRCPSVQFAAALPVSVAQTY